MDGNVELPVDVLHQVFDLLPSNHLAAVSEVCKSWRVVILDRLTNLELSEVRVDHGAKYPSLRSLSFVRLLAKPRNALNLWEQLAHLRLDRLVELNLSFPARKLGSRPTGHGQALLDGLPTCQTLRLLHLANWQLTAATLQQAARLGPNTTSLDLSGCDFMVQGRVSDILLPLQPLHLQELILLNFKMPTDQVLKQLTGFACLHTLSLSAGAMLEARHQSYSGLSTLTGLTRLALCGARSFGDYDLPVLRDHALLRSLDLSGTRVTIEGLESFRHLAQLTSLATGSQHMFGINSAPRLQALLERIDHLARLSLRGCSLRPGLLHLTRFPLLRTLHLDDVDGLSDVWLLLCARLPHLTELRMNNNRNITARGFASLPSLARLHCLGVAGCTGFSSSCLRHLSAFHHLTELILSFEQTDQMRGLLQLAHLPLQKLTFHRAGPDGHTASESTPMFRPVYAANHRRLSEAEIIARLPQHMRVAAARGLIADSSGLSAC